MLYFMKLCKLDIENFFKYKFLNIVLNVILIPFYGLLGAAIATTISNVCLNLIFTLYSKHKLKIMTFPYSIKF